MKHFAPATREWFNTTFGTPTDVQTGGWSAIERGDNALLIAPTGSGKTLAAFLSSIDALVRDGPVAGVHTLYVSPLKALAYDIERNLRVPIDGVIAAGAGYCPTVAVRTGDTATKQRNQFLRRGADILVTTPESLFLLLTSRARKHLASIRTVIVDEIHAIAGTKRGAHLALSLARVAALTENPPNLIGLSATVSPAEQVARFLVGPRRTCCIVDHTKPPDVELAVSVPVEDMTDPLADIPDEQRQDLDDRGMWVSLVPTIGRAIESHNTTIVFVNSRNLCERLTSRLRESLGESVRSHHGSLSREERDETETLLKSGKIKAIVATSSLELGVDMGAVDLVIMPEAPPSTASALQRIGRAGHSVGGQSKALFLPKHRGQLLQVGALAQRIGSGLVEPVDYPRNPLDVLAQQLVAMVALDELTSAHLFSVVVSTASYENLPRVVFDSVLDMLDGKYPSTDFSELRPRVVWNRETDVVTGAKGAQMLAIANAGTIPNRGMYPVHLGEAGPRIGELDEEMVHEMIAGQTFLLGTSTWRVESVSKDRVIVLPAPGEPGQLPFWRGDGASRPYEFGKQIGALTARLCAMKRGEADDFLKTDLYFDDYAAANTLDLIEQQQACGSALPTDHQVVIERFEDELGDARIAILTPFGKAFHATWSHYLQASVATLRDSSSQVVYSDDGMILSAKDCGDWPTKLLLPIEDEVAEAVGSVLIPSALFVTLFREAAGRALLLPRRSPGKRSPLWLTRLRAHRLLDVAKHYEQFPMIIEAQREALQDVLDVSALQLFARDIATRKINVVDVTIDKASPFSQGLLQTFVGTFLYDGDVPAAERKMAALTLDQSLLKELLGTDGPVATVELETAARLRNDLQLYNARYQATSVDDVCYLLSRLGDQSRSEVAIRLGDGEHLIEQAIESGRILEITVGGVSRLIVANEAGLYRDALGIPPTTTIDDYLLPVDNALRQLVSRYARTNGPFSLSDISGWWCHNEVALETVLKQLVSDGVLLHEELVVGKPAQYCSPDLAKRLRRMAINKLRSEITAVSSDHYCAFLARWHSLLQVGPGARRLVDVVATIQGIALPLSDLVNHILPMRLSGFTPRHLSDACASGELVWVGAGALGKTDGKVKLYLRAQLPQLYISAAELEALSPQARQVYSAMLDLRAAFFVEIAVHCETLTHDQLTEALWELVWHGQLTNDTFEPLLTRTRKKRGKFAKAPTGRWSLLGHAQDNSQQERVKRAHSQVNQLLGCYGVVCKQHPAQMDLAIRPAFSVLFELERGLRCRSGIFVDGFVGMQFATTDAIDSLREPTALTSWVVCATDPCNPHGSSLPWPVSSKSVRRVAGARVVFVGGVAALYLDRQLKRWHWLSYDDQVRAHALVKVAELAQTSRLRQISVEKIDGVSVRDSGSLKLLENAGFKSSYNCHVYSAP